VVVVGLAVWAILEVFILTEDDPPAEAATYHNCKMYFKNGLAQDLKLISHSPDDANRWGTDNPPEMVSAGEATSLDFKFRATGNPRPGQMTYETVQDGGIPLQVTLSWKCKGVNLGSPIAKNGDCTQNGGGNYVCEANGLPGGAPNFKSYSFYIYDQFGPPS
jgi:hypothetical protein